MQTLKKVTPSPVSQETPSGLGGMIEQYLAAYFRDHGDLVPTTGLYERILREVERPLLKNTLNHVQGNQVKASEILGIHRNTLRKKIQELGLK